MSGSFDANDALEIGDGRILCAFGKKRSGKSVLARLILESYPGDCAVIAANADDGPFPDPAKGRHLLRGDVTSLPAKWPEYLREDREPLTLRFELDAGSPTFLEDQDHVIGLVLRHGHCAVLVHEVGLLAPSNRVPPHMRRLLHANRHRHVTAILCGPRPVTVDPLVIGQADVVYTFEMPIAADRKRVAETIGWPVPDFEDALDELAPYEYLRFDANEGKPEPGQPDRRLVIKPPLPPEVVRSLP